MKKIIDVPYIDQTQDWPTGCESVSAVMLLKYLGFDISVNQFIEKYLDKQKMYVEKGELYGPDPWVCFAGSPYDKDSYGCYAPVIARALEKVLSDRMAENPKLSQTLEETNIEVKDLTDISMEQILEQYIDNDIPVIFWASIDLLPTIIGPYWTIPETGESFTWISNEHCMLLVGYDEENYYFNDPWHNHGVIGYEKRLVEQRHREQHSMAVSIGAAGSKTVRSSTDNNEA